MSARYHLRYFFDWGAGHCLWSANDPARTAFGYPAKPDLLPLSTPTRAEMERLCAWHDNALNWEYPPDPGPWRQEECDHFNAAARVLLDAIRDELGPAFDVTDEFREMHEDPDLDAYLQGKKSFHR